MSMQGYDRDAARGGTDATADDHTHDHAHGPHGGHGHHHDHGHDHAHRGGLIGWIQHTFAHSHDIHEKVDDVMETHERGFWATRIALLMLGVTTALQLIIVWFSGSVALFADTIHNFGDAANSIPLLFAFALQRRVRSRGFTYGYGRTEDLAGIVIVGSILFSAIVAGYQSIMRIIDPQPIDYLWWVAAAALIGFIGNEAVAALEIRVGRQIGSAALIADGKHARIDGFTSLAVLGAVAGVLLGVPLLDPIVGLLITAAILWITWDAAKAVFRRLLDGIEPHILAEVEHAPLHVDGVHEVHEVRARWIGHKVHADLHITVDPHLTVDESHSITERVYDALNDHVPAFGGAMIHVCPRTGDLQPAHA